MLLLLQWGGRNIAAGSNIVFSNGLLDPWHGGGVMDDVSKSLVAVVIPEVRMSATFKCWLCLALHGAEHGLHGIGTNSSLVVSVLLMWGVVKQHSSLYDASTVWTPGMAGV